MADGTVPPGEGRFLGLSLELAPGVLVPREETELLGRTAIDTLSQLGITEPRVIDMCCGSGNLACAIATHVPDARVWAADLTPEATALAERNVRRLGLESRVTVARGDLFGALTGFSLAGTIDLVVCNPPYISSKRLASDRAFLLEREPREAFDGGPYGLSIHQRTIKEAVAFLRAGGYLAFEVGLGQDKQVTMLFTRARTFDEPRVVKNEAGEGRVVIARMRAQAAAPGVDV